MQRVTRAWIAALAVASMGLTAPSIVAAPGVGVNAYAIRSAAGDPRFTIVVAIDPPSGETLTQLTTTLLDRSGAAVSEWTATRKMLAAPAQTAQFFWQNAGTYRVRVSATTAAKKKVTGEATVTAEMTAIAGGLAASDLVWGVAGPNDTFVARTTPPLDQPMRAMFELYGGRPDLRVSIVMEVAAAPAGPALATLTPSIAATPEPDRFIVTAPVDLARLPAGAAVIRATIGLDGLVPTTIARAIR